MDLFSPPETSQSYIKNSQINRSKLQNYQDKNKKSLHGEQRLTPSTKIQAKTPPKKHHEARKSQPPLKVKHKLILFAPSRQPSTKIHPKRHHKKHNEKPRPNPMPRPTNYRFFKNLEASFKIERDPFTI